MLAAKDSCNSIWECLKLSVNGGEIFIFAAATMGNVALVVHEYSENQEKFPGHLKTLLGIILTVFISSIMFTLYKTDNVLDKNFVNNLAFGIFIIVIALWFKAIYFSKHLSEKSVDIIASEALNNFVEENKGSDELRGFKGE